jgi:hypothetical protein
VKKASPPRETVDTVSEASEAAGAPAQEITIPEVDRLRERVRELEVENASMREIVLRVAEARMARDPVTQIESCLHCSLKRGGAYGYTGKHADTCIVSRARALGF